MKRQMFSVAMVAVFLIGGLNAFSQEQAPAPVFEEGDFWQFKAAERSSGGATRSNPVDGIYELFYSQGKVRIFQMTSGQREVPNRSAIGLLLAQLGKNETIQDLTFPLFVGKKWSYKYEFTAIGARRKLNHDVDINVTGIEQVSTPGGNFRAFKLEKEDAVRLEQHPWVTTYFYSPETKSVIKSFFDAHSGVSLTRDIELIKFGSAH